MLLPTKKKMNHPKLAVRAKTTCTSTFKPRGSASKQSPSPLLSSTLFRVRSAQLKKLSFRSNKFR